MMVKSLSGANDGAEKRIELAEKSIGKSAAHMVSAEILLESGWPDQAVDRLYYALFFVAKAALFLRGKDPTTHNGVKTELIKLMTTEMLEHVSRTEANSLVCFYGERERMRNEATYSFSGEFECLSLASVEYVVAEAKQWADAVCSALCGLERGGYESVVAAERRKVCGDEPT